MSGMTTLAQAVAVTAYLLVAVVWDQRTRRVPNWLTLPVLVQVAVCQVIQFRFEFMAFWLAIGLAWGLRLMGGGDAKLLMVLFGLWPTQEFFLVFASAILAVAAPVLAWRYLPRWRWTLRQIKTRLVAPLPTAEEQATWPPGSWIFALGGILYAWLLVLAPLVLARR